MAQDRAIIAYLQEVYDQICALNKLVLSDPTKQADFAAVDSGKVNRLFQSAYHESRLQRTVGSVGPALDNVRQIFGEFISYLNGPPPYPEHDILLREIGEAFVDVKMFHMHISWRNENGRRVFFSNRKLNRHRRRRLAPERPVTLKEAEAIKVVGDCNGCFAEAARKLGKNRKTVADLYQNGMAKVGRAASRPAGRKRLPEDSRGQAIVVDEADDLD